MTLSDQALDALLKRLHLANTRRAWRDLTRRAEQEAWTYRDFLALVVSEEIAQRQQTRLDRLVRRARFPFLKTIDDFNFLHQSTVRLTLLGSVLASEFVTDGRCVILTGKPGRGKTHLAVAVAYRAIQNGFDARFVTAAELIDDLSAAFRSGRLAEALAAYVQPSVLVCDEVGYLTYGTDAANMLFHVVNDRHRKKRAMIFTTNKPLSAWGGVLHDEDLAHAILDRILERGRLLTLDGPSMRTKHLGLDDPTSPGASDQPARISGIDQPEFPEPTRIVEDGSRLNLNATQRIADLLWFILDRLSHADHTVTGGKIAALNHSEVSTGLIVRLPSAVCTRRCVYEDVQEQLWQLDSWVGIDCLLDFGGPCRCSNRIDSIQEPLISLDSSRGVKSAEGSRRNVCRRTPSSQRRLQRGWI